MHHSITFKTNPLVFTLTFKGTYAIKELLCALDDVLIHSKWIPGSGIVLDLSGADTTAMRSSDNKVLLEYYKINKLFFGNAKFVFMPSVRVLHTL